MDRVRLIAGSHRWLLLASLALLALALGSAMFSGASFSSRSANKSSLAAGSVQLSNSLANTAILKAEGMKPGQSKEGTVEIGNEGNVAEKVVLRAAGISGAALAAALNLEVTEVTAKGATAKWSGKLGSLVEGVSLGSFEASETRTYRFTLSWPAAAAEASLQGASTSLTFKWEGSSS